MLASNTLCNSHRYIWDTGSSLDGFQSLLLGTLVRQLQQVFGLKGSKLGLSLCQYLLVTTLSADHLTLLQRIPHFDSTKRDELAAVFYLKII